MLDYKLKFGCGQCGRGFVHYVDNRGFKIIDGDTYIVVHESNKHTSCPFCDSIMPQKQWRSGMNFYIYIKVQRLVTAGDEC